LVRLIPAGSLRVGDIGHTAFALRLLLRIGLDDVEVSVDILGVDGAHVALEVVCSQETGGAPGQIDAVSKLAAEWLYIKMATNMIEHMVAPFDHPLRLRTCLPATIVAGCSTARAVLVAFATGVQDGVVEGEQLVWGISPRSV